MSQDPQEKKVVAWQEALKVSMSLFIPAFVLMVVSFFLFNPALVNMLTDLRREQVEKEVKKQLGEEIKKQVQEEVKSQVAEERAKILDGQKALLNLDKESPLGRTYVSGEINKQAKEQAEKVAKEEISQAKGDLFGQITFPLIFAIASIFAAFAVKDILTEVLKEQERGRIKRDIETNLRTDLISQIVPKVVAQEKQQITDRLEHIEGYAHWLEHQILNILITQTIDDLKNKTTSLQIDPKFLSAIEKISDRSIVTLEKSSVNFREKYLKEIKNFEESVLSIKLTSIGLSTEEEKALISTFGESSKVRSKSEVYQGQSIFQAQMGLLRVTLSKLEIEGENSREIINILDQIDQIISKDPRVEHQEIVGIATRLQENYGVKPPSWDS
jgi:hypothetical protein